MMRLISSHILSSPRPWGCFWSARQCGTCAPVFPTPVGVFPGDHGRLPVLLGLPHASGGVSGETTPERGEKGSSPRPWGCFFPSARFAAETTVFPTPVGVFPFQNRGSFSGVRLPHARGGVSGCWHCPDGKYTSSPRPWGCFLDLPAWAYRRKVFPTPVGVFLDGMDAPLGQNGLPHARGGVSKAHSVFSFRGRSSPRPWGCFQWCFHRPRPRRVFPMPVGVFLTGRPERPFLCRLPHARGGVSSTLQGRR